MGGLFRSGSDAFVERAPRAMDVIANPVARGARSYKYVGGFFYA